MPERTKRCRCPECMCRNSDDISFTTSVYSGHQAGLAAAYTSAQAPVTSPSPTTQNTVPPPYDAPNAPLNMDLFIQSYLGKRCDDPFSLDIPVEAVAQGITNILASSQSASDLPASKVSSSNLPLVQASLFHH